MQCVCAAVAAAVAYTIYLLHTHDTTNIFRVGISFNSYSFVCHYCISFDCMVTGANDCVTHDFFFFEYVYFVLNMLFRFRLDGVLPLPKMRFLFVFDRICGIFLRVFYIQYLKMVLKCIIYVYGLDFLIRKIDHFDYRKIYTRTYGPKIYVSNNDEYDPTFDQK